MHVRQMKMSDIPAVDQINRKTLPENYPVDFYHYCLAFFPEYCLVAEMNSVVIGYLLAKKEGETGHIISIGIMENFRGFKFGTSLMMHVIKRMLDDRISCITLYVRINNTLAIKFYERLGFFIFQRISKYYPDEVDAYQMKKKMLQKLK